MRKLVGVVLCLVLSACSGESVIGPTTITTDYQPAVAKGPVPPAVEGPPGLSVSGPTGCIDAERMGRVLFWSLLGVQPGAKFEKAYTHDSEASCKPANNLLALRTQNDHLRILPNGVEFDVDTFRCGRAQVDVSVNGQLVIGVVVRYATSCAPPPPEPPKPPTPPVPPVPPTPPPNPPVPPPAPPEPPPPPDPPEPPPPPDPCALTAGKHGTPCPEPPKPEPPKKPKKPGKG